jgi:hypothetical protein
MTAIPGSYGLNLTPFIRRVCGWKLGPSKLGRYVAAIKIQHSTALFCPVLITLFYVHKYHIYDIPVFKREHVGAETGLNLKELGGQRERTRRASDRDHDFVIASILKLRSGT